MSDLQTHLGRWAPDKMIFGYESTGAETLCRDMRDRNSRSPLSYSPPDLPSL